MREIILKATARDKAGKGVARKLRASGKIPAVVYGKEEDTLAIALDHDHFHNAMRQAQGENPLINLQVDGVDSGKKALIKEIQRDPVTGKPLHIDFQHISMAEKIRLYVPIILEGTPEGVKNFGGILSWTMRQVEVSCFPADIPDKITLDVSSLKIHDSIHVKAIKLDKVEILDDPEATIVSVVPPTVVREAGPAAEAEAEAEAPIPEAAEGEAEPEVISEKKVEERKAEKGEDKSKE